MTNLAKERTIGVQRKLKVTLVQPVIPAYNVAFFEALAALEGFEVTIWADIETASQLNQYDSRAHRFIVEQLQWKKIGPLIIRPGLLRRLVMRRPDVVILNCNPRNISEALALILCKVMGIGVGVWNMFHRIGEPFWWTEWYMKYIGRVADLVLCYGRRGKQEQLARGTRADKIRIISTAIDEQPILGLSRSISDGEIEEFRHRNSLHGRHILLHVVRLTSIKRPDLMVRYFSELLRTRDDVELVWIGGGPLEDEIKNIANEVGVVGRMRFLGPLYDERALALWYLSASMFVMATCIGLSIHHAMCYGLPVVTDNSSTTQASEFEVLQDGVNGLTFAPGDDAGFVKKVNMILDDDGLRRKLRDGARKTMESDYTLARKIDNMKVSIEVIGKKRG